MEDTIAPCPFCEDGGKPFLHYNQSIMLSFTIQCRKCCAQGPHAVFHTDVKGSWDKITFPAKEEAIRLWNTRQLKV